jgi:fumarate reductase flavoprotein
VAITLTPLPPSPSRERGARGEWVNLDESVGVERNGPDLAHVINALPPENGLPSLIARAALLRNESRGAHYRLDAPETKPEWRGRIHWRSGQPPGFEEVAA